jgi:hypothetical protein
MLKVRSVFVYTLKILMKLAIGRRSRAREREVKLTYLQSPTNKDKIYLLEKTWTGNNLLLTKEGDKDVIVDDDKLNDFDR